MQRFLSPRELARLGKALDEEQQEGAQMPGVILAIRLLIFTGARKGEILGLTWDMVDLPHGALNLPDSKTGPKTIPLNNPAVMLLRTAPHRADNPHVCPGRLPGKRIVGLQKAWDRIRSRAGLENLRLHDLRQVKQRKRKGGCLAQRRRDRKFDGTGSPARWRAARHRGSSKRVVIR